MSCETCRDLLIELVCDELAADRAAEVRAHALKCERCGPELEKLTRTLKASSSLGLLSPSPEVELRIMQAAREAITGRARGPAREAAPGGTSYGGITEWFARLGSFAMSPQVAMASVLLLVVGIGLYALPFGRDAAEPTALRATEEEGEEHAAAPSPAASATASPIEEQQGEGAADVLATSEADRAQRKAPARTEKEAPALGSARARGANQSGDKASAGRAAGSKEAMELARESKERSVSAFPGAKATLPESKGSGAVAAKPKSAGKALSELADDFAPAPSRAAGGGGAAVGDVSKKSANSVEARASAREPSKDYAQPTHSAYGAPAQAPAPAKSAPVAASAPAPPSTPRSDPAAKSVEQAKADASAALEQGIAASKRGDHAQAEKLLKPIATAGTGSDRSTAMLWLARSLRQRGDCAAALNFYRPLTQPVSAPRAVLEEAADCQERTGNRTAAEKLRARAALPVKE